MYIKLPFFPPNLCTTLLNLNAAHSNLSVSRSLPTDVDECKSGNHDCNVNGTCLNTAGYFECVCNDGYYGDGRICTGWLQKIKIVVAVEVSIGKNAHTCDRNNKYFNCH